MADAEGFAADLESLGFRFLGQNRQGEITYEKTANRFLTYHVHWDPQSNEVLFTWEFAIGEFFDARGMQIGSNESLNLFLFPQYDSKGPAETGFVAGELDRAEQLFRAINFIDVEA
ncbi:MAG: hypothetical protein WAT66_05085 [Actinomycetota bacterium]